MNTRDPLADDKATLALASVKRRAELLTTICGTPGLALTWKILYGVGLMLAVSSSTLLPKLSWTEFVGLLMLVVGIAVGVEAHLNEELDRRMNALMALLTEKEAKERSM